MPGCAFTVTGTKFDVDAFIKDSPWKGMASVFHKGDPTHQKEQPVLEFSRVSIQVSDSNEHRLEQEVCDAMEFLGEEQEEIKRLVAFPGVEKVEFKIGLFWYRDSLCHLHDLPASFLKKAGELGVDVVLCIYGVSGNEPN